MLDTPTKFTVDASDIIEQLPHLRPRLLDLFGKVSRVYSRSDVRSHLAVMPNMYYILSSGHFAGDGKKYTEVGKLNRKFDFSSSSSALRARTKQDIGERYTELELGSALYYERLVSISANLKVVKGKGGLETTLEGFNLSEIGLREPQTAQQAQAVLDAMSSALESLKSGKHVKDRIFSLVGLRKFLISEGIEPVEGFPVKRLEDFDAELLEKVSQGVARRVAPSQTPPPSSLEVI